MPEQEKNQPRPGEQLVLDRSEGEAQPVQEEASGASSIKTTIIVPPVAIAVVMAFLLALVYGVTKVPIAEAKKADKTQKLRAVMPAFDNELLETEKPLTDIPSGKAGNVMLYTGRSGEDTSGYGLTSAVGTGYSGYFSVVIGLNAAGEINAVKILESMETPGLGSKAGEPEFIDQFIGKNLGNYNFMVTKDGGDIDAVTGATITSRAVASAIQQGLENFSQEEDTTTDSIEESEESYGGWSRPAGGE